MPDMHVVAGAYTRPYYTLATLPSAIAQINEIQYILDSTLSEAAGTGSIAAGGGSTRARVLSDGVFWRLYGATKYSGGASSGIVNLITQQDLGNLYWTLNGYTNSVNMLSETATLGGHSFNQLTAIPRPVGTGVFRHTVDLVKLGADQRWLDVGLFAPGFGSGAFAFFDVLNGTVSAPGGYGGFTSPTTAMTPLPGGGYRCSITTDCTASAFADIIIFDQDTNPLGTGTYTGAVTDGYAVSNIALYKVG